MEEWLTISEVAKRLGLAENTCRRYANLFGEYIQSRQYGRAMKYHPETLEILASVSKLYQEGVSTPEIQERLKGAYRLTVDVEPDSPQPLPANVNTINEIRETMAQMAAYLERQEDFSKELLQRLDRQQHYIEESVRARDVHLMEALRELQESKRALAAAAEQAKKKWWRFWK